LLYICGYGFATVSVFYKFFNVFKIFNKRLLLAYYNVKVYNIYLSTLNNFPCIDR